MKSTHLDYDTLADLAEGLLDRERAASADAHLLSCPDCRDRSEELTEVSRILAEAPLPPLPAELAARIDAAILAEAASPARSTSSRRRSLFMLSAAAAVVVVVGGGALAGNAMLHSHMSAADSKAMSPPEGADNPANAPLARHALGIYPSVSSHTDYHAATLGPQLTATLANSHRTLQTLKSQSTDQSSNAAGGTAASLAECVVVTAGGVQPLLVDDARFEGVPATLVVLPDSRPNGLDVRVLGADCKLITELHTTR
ncbi:MAG: hypothetical protein JWN00_4474 [Actinomycetia bacterium]|nr:hypothetical protein [Actinomycetes bacterium]